MMQKTIFQKIIDKEIPAHVVFEDEQCIAFKDINPQAPVHCLIVPKKYIVRVGEANAQDNNLLGHLLLIATQVAHQLKIYDTGFRIVINHGKDSGESVPHLHVHLLGGRTLQWPPG
jgi:histidine triad (HIT) family protein